MAKERKLFQLAPAIHINFALTGAEAEGKAAASFRHDRCVGIQGVVAAHDLTGLRRVQSQLVCHLIDAVRIAELRFGQPELRFCSSSWVRCCLSA